MGCLVGLLVSADGLAAFGVVVGGGVDVFVVLRRTGQERWIAAGGRDRTAREGKGRAAADQACRTVVVRAHAVQLV